MSSSNKSLFVVNIIICFFLVIAFSIIYETNNRIKTLNNTIGVLQSQVDQCNLDIELLRKERFGLEITAFYNIYLNKNTEQEAETAKVTQKATKTIPVTKLVSSDETLLAQLIESEAGNQPMDGKLAVGTVVMNRISSNEFPDTIKDVIFQKGQFSVVPNNAINNKPSEDSLKAAKDILNGKRTLGPDVLYFYNPKLTSKTNWVRSRKVSKVIDDHVFAM